MFNRRIIDVLTAMALSGCAYLPPALTPGASAREHLTFFSHATESPARVRERLWQEYAGGRNAGEQLRRALLQSIPGGPRYDPAAAEAELRSLLVAAPDVAAVARHRLETLRSLGECRAEADVLKKRLSKIADIERRSDKPSRSP